MTPIKQFQKSFFVFICLGIIINLSSCTTVDEDAIRRNTPLTTENIDLIIKGDLEQELHIESDDLVTYQPSQEGFINLDEYDMNLILDNGDFIKFTLYHRYEENLLNEDLQFSAYTIDRITDRISYVIGEYYIDGVKTYSTIAENAPSTLQINVFNAEQKENFYRLNLNGMTFFKLSDKDIGRLAKTLTIDGSFTLLD